MHERKLTQSQLVQIALSLSQSQRDELQVNHRQKRIATPKLIEMGLCDECCQPSRLGRQILDAVGEGFKGDFGLPGDPVELRRAFTKQQRDDFVKVLLEQLYVSNPHSDQQITISIGGFCYEILRRPKVIRHLLRIISPFAVSKPLVPQEAMKSVA